MIKLATPINPGDLDDVLYDYVNITYYQEEYVTPYEYPSIRVRLSYGTVDENGVWKNGVSPDKYIGFSQEEMPELLALTVSDGESSIRGKNKAICQYLLDRGDFAGTLEDKITAKVTVLAEARAAALRDALLSSPPEES